MDKVVIFKDKGERKGIECLGIRTDFDLEYYGINASYTFENWRKLALDSDELFEKTGLCVSDLACNWTDENKALFDSAKLIPFYDEENEENDPPAVWQDLGEPILEDDVNEIEICTLENLSRESGQLEYLDDTYIWISQNDFFEIEHEKFLKAMKADLMEFEWSEFIGEDED